MDGGTYGVHRFDCYGHCIRMDLDSSAIKIRCLLTSERLVTMCLERGMTLSN